MSKGSSPRPFSVSQNVYANNYDLIFGKKKDMQVRENANKCGCGRSPTGKCIGWHRLSKEQYEQKLKEFNSKTS